VETGGDRGQGGEVGSGEGGVGAQKNVRGWVGGIVW